MIDFIANPYALLTDKVVTDVVYMQDYTAEQIAETLKNYSYEEAVPWSEYGSSLYVGYVRIGSWIVPPARHSLWVFDEVEGVWNPPSDWNESIEGWFPLCGQCDDHKEQNTSSDLESISSLKKETINAN